MPEDHKPALIVLDEMLKLARENGYKIEPATRIVLTDTQGVTSEVRFTSDHAPVLKTTTQFLPQPELRLVGWTSLDEATPFTLAGPDKPKGHEDD